MLLFIVLIHLKYDKFINLQVFHSNIIIKRLCDSLYIYIIFKKEVIARVLYIFVLPANNFRGYTVFSNGYIRIVRILY